MEATENIGELEHIYAKLQVSHLLLFIFQLHFIFQLLFIFFYVSFSLLILLKALEAFLLFLLNDYISFKNVKFQGLGILLVK